MGRNRLRRFDIPSTATEANKNEHAPIAPDAHQPFQRIVEFPLEFREPLLNLLDHRLGASAIRTGTDAGSRITWVLVLDNEPLIVGIGPSRADGAIELARYLHARLRAEGFDLSEAMKLDFPLRLGVFRDLQHLVGDGHGLLGDYILDSHPALSPWPSASVLERPYSSTLTRRKRVGTSRFTRSSGDSGNRLHDSIILLAAARVGKGSARGGTGKASGRHRTDVLDLYGCLLHNVT